LLLLSEHLVSTASRYFTDMENLDAAFV
jgi:hypothetical protein